MQDPGDGKVEMGGTEQVRPDERGLRDCVCQVFRLVMKGEIFRQPFRCRSVQNGGEGGIRAKSDERNASRSTPEDHMLRPHSRSENGGEGIL